MALTIELTLIRCGEPDTGLWCDNCLLPSLLRFRFAIVSGMHVLKELTCAACPDCGRRDWDR